jgi:hypothetical protein
MKIYLIFLIICTNNLLSQVSEILINPLWGPNTGQIGFGKYDNYNNIYITSQNGLFKSTDEGNTWSNIFHKGIVYSSTFNLKNELFVLLCETDNDDYRNFFYKSLDNGNTWYKIKQDSAKFFFCNNKNVFFKYVTARPNNNERKYSIYYSSNDGEDWVEIRSKIYNIDTSFYISMSINEFDNLVLYEHHSIKSNIIESSMSIYNYNTAIWDDIKFMPFRIQSTLFLTKDSILVACSDGLYITTNYGVTWNNIFSVDAQKVYKHQENYYLCSSKSGLFFSQNNFLNFKNISQYYINSLFFTKSNEILATNYTYILKSTDYGYNWYNTGKGFTSANVLNFTINKFNKIFCNTFVNYSCTSDKGKSWRDYEYGLIDFTFSDIKGNVYLTCGLDYALVLRSTNNGETFDTITKPGTIPFGTDRVVVNSNGYIFIGGVIMRSIDEGKTWEWMEFGGNGLSINSEDHLFLTNNQGGIFRSTDDGVLWEQVHDDIDINTDLREWGMLFSPFDSTGYAYATEGEVLYKTTNNGSSWKRIDDDFLLFINAACIDSLGNIYFLSYNNLYVKWNGKDSFIKYKLSDIYNFLDIQAAPDGDIYLGSERGGLFRLNKDIINGVSVEEVQPSPLFAFPNPASDYIEIDLERCPTSARCWTSDNIRIYNSIGECVMTTNVGANGRWPLRIDTSNLPPGIYFLRCGGQYAKFVKM